MSKYADSAAGEDQEDPGSKIVRLLVKEIIHRLENAPGDMKAADFEMIRKLMSDNALTLASVRSGKFGSLAKEVAEQYPFQEGDTVQ